MSSLGELFFSLGLDSKEFDKAIDEAKKKVAELDSGSKIKLQLDVEHLKSQIQEATKSISANGVSINTKVNTERIENLRRLLEESKQQAKELEAAIANASTPPSIKAMKQRELQDVTRRIAEQEARLQSKTGTSVTAPPVPVRTVLDAESVNVVRMQLAKFGEPITAKVSVEYDIEKLQATQAVLKSLEKRIGVAVDAPTSNSEASSSIAELSRRIEALGKATEKISKQAVGRRSVASIEEEEMRRYNSQLQRLEEGVRKWQNVKAKIESSKIDKSSDNYKNAIRLIDAYIDKLVEAQKQAGKFTNRELTGMLGQTASGEIAKTGRLVAQQKSDEQTIRNNLVKEQAQIQRLEEGVRRIQNVIAKLNATDVDKSGSGYKQAISLLNDYIDKLNTAKRLAGSFSKREMAGMLGQTMSGEIAEAERLVAAQRKLEQSKKESSKSAAQAEKEEIQLKRAKLQLEKELANLGKAKAQQQRATLQKDRESVRLKKEQVSLQKRLGAEIKKTNTWASQFRNYLTNIFSIYSISRFIRNLYTIGGEFQKQQIALRSMIGDYDKANAIFERMKTLSVKSPFTFSELASYTKQMAAYGIEYENLYDTTKRLADISAGVGVDMGRLILAYGQVRSAEVLRGQELRQFTEAGIPLVSELAKRLSVVRGEAVKVG
ncbi:MAG: hypothetical protein J6P97_07035, partial [Bacteroidales bacterium]|nr:hypothetical protein [Bacteroidales bacterium]